MLVYGIKLWGIATYGRGEFFSCGICDYSICIVTYPQDILLSRLNGAPKCPVLRIIKAVCRNKLTRGAVQAYFHMTLK